ncbi:autotransporter-associated beta strand repeat-containing protein [Roseiarcaceae bacterium H3SJ34-1]|uniref:autotransporter-associated beta strand repeat-containing protein n=1 Tax=Terripilifer ovatus TaxID=3032367 RepID=UPI003AB9A894|nr:autotransporter-associated beta strand repeat-containing protein [Roseiarcaceae bacterium H3SJ34-1]
MFTGSKWLAMAAFMAAAAATTGPAAADRACSGTAGSEAALNYEISCANASSTPYTITQTSNIALTADAMTFSGSKTTTLSGNGFSLNGPYGVTIQNSQGVVFGSTGTGNYSGVTYVDDNAVLKAGAVNAWSPLSQHILANGTLDLSGFNQTVGSLSGDGTVTNSGTAAAVLTAGGDNSDTWFSGIFQDGAGKTGFTKTGTGIMTLTGQSTNSGPTTIADGVLRAGTYDALSYKSALTVQTGATFDLNGYDQTVMSLSGGGTVTAGMYNNYGTYGRGEVYTTSLTVTGADSSTFSGVLEDGTGRLRLVKSGSGTLSLSGVNTYSGGTEILQGTLSVNNGQAAGSGDIYMQDGTTLAFTGTNYTLPNNIVFTGIYDPTFDTGPGNITLSGVISGAGDLSKVGAGVLTLTGTNTYTGNTFVNAGTLEVNGSIATSLLTTVASGATLSGTGTVGPINALDGSTISPGNAANPYGTLYAIGPAVMAPGSRFAVSVSPGGASSLDVNGTANISGSNLVINAAPGTYDPSTRYTIMTASGGVTGSFSGVSMSGVSGYTPVVTYDATHVFLGFAPAISAADAAAAYISVERLAGDRFGQIVTTRVLASVLVGFNEQINCDGCISVFGSVGSFSAGFHGRKNITENLSLIGGAAFAHYKSGGAEVTSAPIVAAALRYDMVELGAFRPFAEVGILASPFQRTTYSRNYANSGNWVGGKASVNTSNYALFGKAGWVYRFSRRDELSSWIEISRNWQMVGGYADTAGGSNPIPVTIPGGVDRVNLAKLAAQWTHLWGSQIETQMNLGVARSFDSRSGVSATLVGLGPINPTMGEYTWVEYGMRVGYRLQKGIVIDAFANGTLAKQPIGNTIHSGVGVRYLF